jgi:hypothetical protein
MCIYEYTYIRHHSLPASPRASLLLAWAVWIAANEDHSNSLTPTLEPLRLSGLCLFPFIPLFGLSTLKEGLFSSPLLHHHYIVIDNWKFKLLKAYAFDTISIQQKIFHFYTRIFLTQKIKQNYNIHKKIKILRT